MGNLFVPQKGQLDCCSKEATHLSLKKGNLYVPQNGPLKGAFRLSFRDSTCLSLKWQLDHHPQKGNYIVIQKVQPVCASKRSSRLSFKRGNMFIPHAKGQIDCHSKGSTCLSLKSKGQLNCYSKGTTCLSLKKGATRLTFKSDSLGYLSLKMGN